MDEDAGGIFGAPERPSDFGVRQIFDESENQGAPLFIGKTVDGVGQSLEVEFVGQAPVDVVLGFGPLDFGLFYGDGGHELATLVVGAGISCGVEKPGFQRRRPDLFGFEMPQSLGEHLGGDVFCVVVIAYAALNVGLDWLDIPGVNFMECRFAPCGCAPNRLFGWIVHVE